MCVHDSQHDLFDWPDSRYVVETGPGVLLHEELFLRFTSWVRFYPCKFLLSDFSLFNRANTWRLVRTLRVLFSLCVSPQKALGVFGLCQIYSFIDYVRSKLSADAFQTLFKTVAAVVGGVVAVIALALQFSGSRELIKYFGRGSLKYFY